MINRPVVIPFGNLLNACSKHDMKARLYLFDGGETVEVSDSKTGAQVLRVTSEHGDVATASEMAAKELMERGLLWVGDFEG